MTAADDVASMHRHALDDIPLSDGNVIPKGASVIVSGHVMRENSVYPDPRVYNGYRFYQKRQEPGNENKHQLVMTSTEHFGFGHGVHACPGRFFASNEIKTLLVHLLMKYDFKFPDGKDRPRNMELGTEIVCDQTAKVLVRAREPEVDVAGFGEVSQS